MINKIKGLINNDGFMKYFQNTSWLMFEKVLRIIVALTIGVWVTRYLGPKDFGILSYAQSFVGLFTAFSSLGLDGLLSRELVKEPEHKNVLLGTALGLQTIGSTILMGFLLISMSVSDNDALTTKIIVILGLLTFLNSFNIIGAYFGSIVKSKLPMIASICCLLISSSVKVFLILKGFSLIYFAYALAFDTIILIAGLIYVYYLSGASLSNWKFSKSISKSLLSDSWPLIINTIFISIYVRMDQVMIKWFLDESSVGQYAAAVTLSQAWYFIPGIISGSLFPAIINAKKKDEKLYKDRLQRLYDLMVIIALSIAIPMTFLSDVLVEFLYGINFDQTGKVLRIHIWAGVFVFLGVSVQKWILTENLQRISTYNLFIGMVVNIILNYILIPKYSIVGAAFATIISQAISVFFAPLLFKKLRPSFFMMLKSLSLTSILERLIKSKK